MDTDFLKLKFDELICEYIISLQMCRIYHHSYKFTNDARYNEVVARTVIYLHREEKRISQAVFLCERTSVSVFV